jgi:hypothetical protein
MVLGGRGGGGVSKLRIASSLELEKSPPFLCISEMEFLKSLLGLGTEEE